MSVTMTTSKSSHIKYKNSGDEERKTNPVLGRRKILVFHQNP